MNEPIITINGQQLTTAQVMAVRLAIESFLLDLNDSGLGDDKTGKQMTASYADRLNELVQLIHTPTKQD